MATPTIKDVARLAGVSPTAVSFVLNHKAEGRLGVETIAKVREAIRELDYRPDGFARRAGWRRAAAPVTMGVGYLGADLTNAFHGAVIMAAAQEMQREGYHLIFASKFRAAEEAIAHIRSLHGTVADGWLLTSVVQPEVIDHVVQSGIPAVFVGSGTDVQGRLPQVRVDDYDGGYRATRHLLALGHRRIGFLATYPQAAFTRWRFDGYRAALHDAGLPVIPEDVWQDQDELQVEPFIRRCVAGAQPPTAFFVMGEPLALEVIRVLRGLGLSVPRDVSVLGFDDTGLAQVADPPLTTIASPRADLGAVAFQQLKALLQAPRALRSGRGRARQEPPLTVLPVELVLRGSTAPVRERVAAGEGR